MLYPQIIQLWKQCKTKKTFERQLLAIGFKIVGWGESSLVYSRKDVDFVVKVSSYLTDTPLKNKILEKFRLPYLFVNRTKSVGIQLKASARTQSSRYKAWKKIRDAAVGINLDFYDIHQDNVGWINRKPVIFDHK